MSRKAKPDPMRGYKPMRWPADCRLTAHELEMIEIQRRDLWRHGIRKQPMLDRMALEFGYVVCASQAADPEHSYNPPQISKSLRKKLKRSRLRPSSD